MKMAPPSLTNMPSEVLMRVFRHTTTFSTASALSRTSPAIHAIWTANIPVICHIILPIAIECYEQASELFGAQEEVAPVAGALWSRLLSVWDSERRELPEIRYLSLAPMKTKMAIEKVRRMVSNAKLMESILERFNVSETWTSLSDNFQLEPREMRAAERERFIKAYYRATSLATLVEEPNLRRRFAHLDRFEFLQLSDVTLFMGAKKNPCPMLKLSNYCTNKIISSPCERSLRNWNDFGDILRSAHYRLLKLPMNQQFIRSYNELELRYQFIRDGQWERAKEGRGPPLGKLLALG